MPSHSTTDLDASKEAVAFEAMPLEDAQHSPATSDAEKAAAVSSNDHAESEWSRVNIQILLSASLLAFVTVGFSNAFGVFEAYYLETLPVDSSAISWLGSLAIFFLFAGSLGVSILLQKVQPRWLVLAGSILVLLGIFMTSLTSKFWQLVLTQGLLVGLGNSLMFTPAMICVTMAFFKNRGIALGLFVAGSSIGGVIWPIALGRLLRQHGFDWTFRIAGFIMIPLCVISTIMIRMPVMKAGAGPPPKPDLKLLFKNKIYLTFAVGGWFAYMGLFAGLFFIAAYAVHIGINQSLAFYLVSIVNAASLFGRVVPGFLADRWGPLNLFAISAVLSGIITACLTACTTTPGLIIYAVAYGFCSGATISLLGACVAPVVPRELGGPAIGLMMAFMSVAALVGTPMSGAILDSAGYLPLSLFAGVCMIFGGSTVGLARYMVQPKLFAKA